mmetsp:Transcript_19314/g.68271  ORF Transcript_19314/g.68271 Transcript_19314/m.68271 type:complete len:320 (-) Transcript_19314:631-1590(-)
MPLPVRQLLLHRQRERVSDHVASQPAQAAAADAGRAERHDLLLRVRQRARGQRAGHPAVHAGARDAVHHRRDHGQRERAGGGARRERLGRRGEREPVLRVRGQGELPPAHRRRRHLQALPQGRHDHRRVLRAEVPRHAGRRREGAAAGRHALPARVGPPQGLRRAHLRPPDLHQAVAVAVGGRRGPRRGPRAAQRADPDGGHHRRRLHADLHRHEAEAPRRGLHAPRRLLPLRLLVLRRAGGPGRRRAAPGRRARGAAGAAAPAVGPVVHVRVCRRADELAVRHDPGVLRRRARLLPAGDHQLGGEAVRDGGAGRDGVD